MSLNQRGTLLRTSHVYIVWIDVMLLKVARIYLAEKFWSFTIEKANSPELKLLWKRLNWWNHLWYYYIHMWGFRSCCCTILLLYLWLAQNLLSIEETWVSVSLTGSCFFCLFAPRTQMKLNKLYRIRQSIQKKAEVSLATYIFVTW